MIFFIFSYKQPFAVVVIYLLDIRIIILYTL